MRDYHIIARQAWLKAAKAARKPIPPPRYRPAIYPVPAKD